MTIVWRVRADERCSIHDEELVDTNPADLENGPCPEDLDNELVCYSCVTEEETAYQESLCLGHKIPLGICLYCAFADDKEVA